QTLQDRGSPQGGGQGPAERPSPLWDRRALLLAGSAWLLASCASRRGAAHPARPPGPAPAATQRPISGLIYTVEQGDTISHISRRSGLSIEEIIAANDLADPYIAVGQRLRLPGVLDLHADPLAAVRHARSEPTSTALPTTRLRLIRRTEWTKQGLRANHRAMGPVHRLTVHHTSEHGRMARMNDIDVVRSIDNYHRNERKWAAIGYHYLIGRDGRVYEGRPTDVQGAHTRGNNRNNVGISMIGDFNRKLPNQAQLVTLTTLLEQQRKRYNLPKRLIFGHRDLSPSVCPGQQLYDWLQRYKRS
ncbi:MAG: N-acetylmuramoyl-L-alanine amidase, partial [Planctomycetota bacterium]